MRLPNGEAPPTGGCQGCIQVPPLHRADLSPVGKLVADLLPGLYPELAAEREAEAEAG